MTMRNWNNPLSSGTPAARAHAVKMLLAASLLTTALYFVPAAGFLTYPLRILVTFIHEGSHALVALLTGGIVGSIAIQPDGSGVTQTMGGINPLISAAGYLGATFYGALLIGLMRRGVSGKTLLTATGGLVGLVTIGVILGVLMTGNVFGLFWGIILCAGLLIAGRKLSDTTAGWVAAFVGVQCVMNALFDLRTLFSLTLMPGAQNDAMNMQRLTLIPAPFWAALWIVTAFAMLAFVLRPVKKSAVRLA